MKSLREASAGFAALLAVTLGCKLLAAQKELPADGPLFAEATALLLIEEGFAASTRRGPYRSLVEAKLGDCRIEVRDYDPHGTFGSTFAELARPIGSLHFVYRGTVTDSAPKVRPLIEYYLRREALRIGLSPPRAPIAAVAASPTCDLKAIEWQRIAMLPS